MSRNQFLINLHCLIDRSITINANCKVRRSRSCCLVHREGNPADTGSLHLAHSQSIGTAAPAPDIRFKRAK
jgi:hypothetical protein